MTTQTEERFTNFTDWMARVNTLVQAQLGVSALDLPDQDYSGMFEDEFTPGEVVDSLMEELDYLDELRFEEMSMDELNGNYHDTDAWLDF